MPEILLTGFGPFPGTARNPSETIVRYIDRHPERSACPIQAVVLPVELDPVRVLLPDLIQDLRPHAVVLCGVAGPGRSVAVERVALNAAHAEIADAGGRRLAHEPVVPEGPAAYFSGINCSGVVAALARDGLRAHVSYHAGTYLCNAAYYLACREMTRLTGAPRAVFVHVPNPAPAESSLPYAQSRKAVLTAAEHIGRGEPGAPGGI
jgi:pyroglutamyl-peptidase